MPSWMSISSRKSLLGSEGFVISPTSNLSCDNSMMNSLLRVVFPTHGRLEARLEARYAGMTPGGIANADEETTIARSATNA